MDFTELPFDTHTMLQGLKPWVECESPTYDADAVNRMMDLAAHDFATLIDNDGIAVRAGTHCAMPLLERFGVAATCRASFGLYNTREEVDRFVAALSKAQELIG